MNHEELKDTKAIEEFMLAFGQECRTRPVADVKASSDNSDMNVPEHEVKLRAELITEELFELLTAMGFHLTVDDSPIAVGEQQKYSLTRHPDVPEGQVYDSLETLDALGDLIYVIKGSGIALGMNIDAAVLDSIQPSNMSKLGSDGKPIKRADGKLLKAENYFAPTETLKNVLQNGR